MMASDIYKQVLAEAVNIGLQYKPRSCNISKDAEEGTSAIGTITTRLSTWGLFVRIDF